MHLRVCWCGHPHVSPYQKSHATYFARTGWSLHPVGEFERRVAQSGACPPQLSQWLLCPCTSCPILIVQSLLMWVYGRQGVLVQVVDWDGNRTATASLSQGNPPWILLIIPFAAVVIASGCLLDLQSKMVSPHPSPVVHGNCSFVLYFLLSPFPDLGWLQCLHNHKGLVSTLFGPCMGGLHLLAHSPVANWSGMRHWSTRSLKTLSHWPW